MLRRLLYWLERRERKLFEHYQKEDQELFDRRMKTIQSIASKNMKPAELYKGGFPVRDTVVVPYEDLLRIWDIADRAKFETPVQRAYL